MIKNTRTPDLACIYKLLIRVESGLKTMCSTISGYLRELGRALVSDDDTKTSITYVQVNIMTCCKSLGLCRLSDLIGCCVVEPTRPEG